MSDKPPEKRYFNSKAILFRKEDPLGGEPEKGKTGEDAETKYRRTFEIVGVVASVVALTSYIPITVDVFQRPSRYIVETTFLVYGIYIAANLLWLTYGIGHKSIAIIITSLVVITISLTILIYIIVFAYDNILKFATASHN